ncbi:MAG: flavodoxin family protein [Candidatus Helarchaeota archaeon]
MKALFISGSPRKKSNTDYLLHQTLSIIGGDFIKLSNYDLKPCNACWMCLEKKKCVILDDFTQVFLPQLLKSDIIVLGSPVFFNNVSAQLKTFIDRTWSIRGRLRNKIGGAIVVGRKYGAANAISAINTFFLKHEMIPANRGVHGIAFKKGEIKNDSESIEAAKKLGTRILELAKILNIE